MEIRFATGYSDTVFRGAGDALHVTAAYYIITVF